MSVSFEITAQPRSDTGKGASRRLRRTGMVPGIIYGGHQEPSMISLAHNELILHLDHEAFYSHILNLKVGDATEQVVLKDLQRHPAKPFIMHIDFQRISAGEKIPHASAAALHQPRNRTRHQGGWPGLPHAQ